MKTVLDYGQIKSAKTMPNGTIRFYGRVAKSDRPMVYRNRDGSTRKELITQAELFKPESMDSLKIAPITHPHAPVDLTPDNTSRYAKGATGNTVSVDNGFLGVIGTLWDREAIDAFNGGVRELSPGYLRELAPLSEGLFQQLNRDYFELSLVPRARGGSDVRIKDAEDADIWEIDPSQIDDNLRDFWNGEFVGDSADAVDKLLNFGTLTPQPIILPTKKMELIDLKIGGVSLKVDSSCAQDAMQLGTEFQRLQTAVASNEASAKDSLKDSLTHDLELKAARDQVADLTKKLQDATENAKNGIAPMVKALTDAATDLKVFGHERIGLKVAEAQKALDACDLAGYQAAIVAATYPDRVFDAAQTETAYAVIRDFQTQRLRDMGFLSGLMAGGGMGKAQQMSSIHAELPSQLAMVGGSGLAEDVIRSEGSGEMSLINRQNTFKSSLPPDSRENGWDRPGV